MKRFLVFMHLKKRQIYQHVLQTDSSGVRFCLVVMALNTVIKTIHSFREILRESLATCL